MRSKNRGREFDDGVIDLMNKISLQAPRTAWDETAELNKK
jgi:hypothetical protein